MLKIFHKKFFENLSGGRPPFLSTKKSGLLSLIFLTITIFAEVDGRYVGGFGPLRAGNKNQVKKWKIKLKGNRILHTDNQEQY